MEDETNIGDLDSTIKLLQNLSLHSALTENQPSPSPSAPTTTIPISFDRSQWVDFLVNEMASATTMEDARSRASKALGIMEGSGFQVAGVPALQEVDMVKKANSILKKAVCIQYQQVKKLEEENATFKEKLRCLETNNYALSMHLKQLSACDLGPHRSYFLPPDVY